MLWKCDLTLKNLRLFRIIHAFHPFITGLINPSPMILDASKLIPLLRPPISLTFLKTYISPTWGQSYDPPSPCLCPRSWAQPEIKIMQQFRLESRTFTVSKWRQSARKVPDSLIIFGQFSFPFVNVCYPAKYSSPPHTLRKQSFL